MEISIVTGTYNRLNSLQKMVRSVQENLDIEGFHDYEIVIVDGGSTDGTIEWCKSTPKVTLIEQGKLLGAVKAFNEGAYKAKGRYIVLANDDITFLRGSILRAYNALEHNEGIAVGCFYQDRDGLPMYVSSMIAQHPDTGDLCTVHYGQVCMVPKWFGDAVGWWGDYLHTYGGDCELSCQAWELGFGVVPIKNACISDGKIDDELRKRNQQGVVLESGMHPDTLKWKSRWPHGPKINSRVGVLKKPVIAKRMRIMYFPLIERGNRLQIMTKTGLRDALHKKGVVLQYDYINKGWNAARTLMEFWQPDLCVFQLQNYDKEAYELMLDLKSKYKTTKFVNWNGDYHPNNVYNIKYMLMMDLFDLCGFVFDVGEQYKDINWFYWQIGYEISNAVPNENTPKHDVVFLGNCYSQARYDLGKHLRSLTGVDVGLYGNWPDELQPNGDNLYDFDAGAKIYRNAKIAISTQQYPDGYGFVSNRLFQALSAGGCAVLQQEFKGMELVGIKHDQHVLLWEDFTELDSWIYELLNDEEGRKELAEEGQKYAIHNHSFDIRVKELWDELYA